jgi:hypothetical protein
MITFAAIALMLVAASTRWSTIGAAEAEKKIHIDEATQEVLKQMSQYLGQAKAFHVRVMSFYDLVRKSGIKVKAGFETEVFVQRPDKVYLLRQRDDLSHSQLWYDGSSLSVLHREKKEYSTIKVPKTIDAMIDHLIDHYDLPMPLADFLYSDIYGAFHEYLISGEYLGQRLVDGVMCHHLSFESTGVDWQLWVEAGERPLPRRFVITYLNLPGEPEYFAKFTKWGLDPPINTGMYHFAPPKDAKKVPLQTAKKKP